MISSKTHEIMLTTPSHHRLIWSRPLSEGEEVLFFLADNRHTLMSRTSIGREGESIFWSHGLDLTYNIPCFWKFRAQLQWSECACVNYFENNYAFNPLRTITKSWKMASALYLENFLESESFLWNKDCILFRYLDSVRTKGVVTLALC